MNEKHKHRFYNISVIVAKEIVWKRFSKGRRVVLYEPAHTLDNHINRIQQQQPELTTSESESASHVWKASCCWWKLELWATQCFWELSTGDSQRVGRWICPDDVMTELMWTSVSAVYRPTLIVPRCEGPRWRADRGWLEREDNKPQQRTASSAELHVNSSRCCDVTAACFWTSSLNNPIVALQCWLTCSFDFVKYQGSPSRREHVFCTACQHEFAFCAWHFTSPCPGPRACWLPAGGNRANTDPSEEMVTGPAALGSHHHDTTPLHVATFLPKLSSRLS